MRESVFPTARSVAERLPSRLYYDFDSGRRTIGVLATGSAIVERVDQRGDRTILEHLQPGGVFGEMLMFRNVLGDSVDVTCEKPCCVWFFPEEKLENRCEKNCTSTEAVDCTASSRSAPIYSKAIGHPSVCQTISARSKQAFAQSPLRKGRKCGRGPKTSFLKPCRATAHTAL